MAWGLVTMTETATLPDLRAVAFLDATEDEYAGFAAAYQAAIAQNPAIAAPLTNVLIVGSSDASGSVPATSVASSTVAPQASATIASPGNSPATSCKSLFGTAPSNAPPRS